MSLFPLVRFDPIELGAANAALERWAHRMGPVNRPYPNLNRAHGLLAGEELVAVTVTTPLVRECVGGISGGGGAR